MIGRQQTHQRGASADAYQDAAARATGLNTPHPLAQLSHLQLVALRLPVVEETDLGPDDLSDHPPEEQPRDLRGEVY